MVMTRRVGVVAVLAGGHAELQHLAGEGRGDGDFLAEDARFEPQQPHAPRGLFLGGLRLLHARPGLGERVFGIEHILFGHGIVGEEVARAVVVGLRFNAGWRGPG